MNKNKQLFIIVASIVLIMVIGGCMMAQQPNYPHGLPTAEESAQASEDIPLLVDEIIRKQEQSASYHIEETTCNENQFEINQSDEIRDNIYALRVRDESYVERTKEWLIANKEDYHQSLGYKTPVEVHYGEHEKNQ